MTPEEQACYDNLRADYDALRSRLAEVERWKQYVIDYAPDVADEADAFLAPDRMLDLTPVGPGETVDDALSRQKSPIWEREPPHCPTCDCPTAADRENERD